MNSASAIHAQEIKEEIRSRIDISTVVGKYVKLRSYGHSLKGLCPFHKEKTPSFTVNPEKEVFHCFGCGKGGDVFTFLMEIEGISFPEALQKMAEETGVTIPSFKLQKNISGINKEISRSELLKIHELATCFYYENMKKSQEAVSYLKYRGLSAETVKEFRIGFAMKGWQNFTTYAKSNGISDSVLTGSGLVVSSSQDTSCYDRFRDRIIFPIFDISGKPVGFGGRGLDNTVTPKYLNSPETILYHKNRILYGMHKARNHIKEKGFVFIVEGYLDFLSLFQSGIKNVVATSGTALSEEHGHLLSRFTSKVVLVFDGDNAGIMAAQRAVFILAPFNLDVSVLILPEEDDPDTYIRNHGADKFLEAGKNSDSGLQYIINQGIKLYDNNSGSGKSNIVDFCLPLLQATADTIILAAYIKEIAETLALKEELIYNRLNKIIKYDEKVISFSEKTEEKLNSTRSFIATQEGSLLHILVKQPSLINRVTSYLSDDFFRDSISRKLYSYLVTLYSKDNSLDSVIAQSEDEQMKQILSMMLTTDIITENYEEDILYKAKRCIINVYTHQKKMVTRQLKQERNPEIRNKLLQKQKELITQCGVVNKEWLKR